MILYDYDYHDTADADERSSFVEVTPVLVLTVSLKKNRNFTVGTVILVRLTVIFSWFYPL